MVQTRKCVIVFYIFLINLLVLSIGSYIIYKHLIKEAEKQNSGGKAEGLHQEAGGIDHHSHQNILLTKSAQTVQYPPDWTFVDVLPADNLASRTKFTTRMNSSEIIHGSTSSERRNSTSKNRQFNSPPPNDHSNSPPISYSANANSTINPLASDLNITPNPHSTHETFQTTNSEGGTIHLHEKYSSVSTRTSKTADPNVNKYFDTNVQEETISKFENNESSYNVSSETRQPIFSADVGSQPNKSDTSSYVTINNGIFESKIVPPITKTEEEYQETDYSHSTSENTINENMIGSAHLNFSTGNDLPVIEPSGGTGDQKSETIDITSPTETDLKSDGGGDSKIEEHHDITFPNSEPLVYNSITTSHFVYSGQHTSTISVSGETSTSKSLVTDSAQIPQSTSLSYNLPTTNTNTLLATLMKKISPNFTEHSTTQIFNTRGSLATKTNVESSAETPSTYINEELTRNSAPLAETSTTTSYSSPSTDNSPVSKANEQSESQSSVTVDSLGNSERTPHLTHPNLYRDDDRQADNSSTPKGGPRTSSNATRNDVPNANTKNHSATDSTGHNSQKNPITPSSNPITSPTAQVFSTNEQTMETKPKVASNKPKEEAEVKSGESSDQEGGGQTNFDPYNEGQDNETTDGDGAAVGK